MPNHTVVSQSQWLDSRKALLQKEMALAEQQEAITEARSSMPWVHVEKNYDFESVRGDQNLASLFGNKSQLIIYHFMFSADWDEGSSFSAFDADNFDDIIVHLNSRDIAFAVVSGASAEKLARYEQRMKWNFNWVSSLNNSFTDDFHVNFMQWQKQQLEQANVASNHVKGCDAPGISVFCKEADGSIFHTYSGFTKNMEMLNSAYLYMDLTPKGRDSYGLFQ